MPSPAARDPFGRFDFDLARAVLEQLVTAFSQLPIGTLDAHTILRMEKEQGVYQLFLGDVLQYVGKADDLPHRLARHEKALSARLNLDVSKVGFKALYIHTNWTTWATEDAMIRHFSPNNPHLWNTSGFGSNDPGRNRDFTSEEGTFNGLYPINSDIVCPWLAQQTDSAWNILNFMKEKLPFLLRFQRVTTKFRGSAERKAEEQLKNTQITIPRDGMTAREALIFITQSLGAGWQATQLKGRLILYKENRDYDYGEVLCRG